MFSKHEIVQCSVNTRLFSVQYTRDCSVFSKHEIVQCSVNMRLFSVQ